MTEANEKVEDEVAYEKKWYIIHTYSGYEKKVAADLEKRIESLDLTDRVFRILVPEEEVLEEKRGKMVKVPRKLFPSYVMIEMLSVREENELGLGYRVDSDAWYVIRNTNEVVAVKGGSFDGQQGEISEIDHEHGKIKVMLEVLGRLTPVEVEHTEIEKIDY